MPGKKHAAQRGSPIAAAAVRAPERPHVRRQSRRFEPPSRPPPQASDRVVQPENRPASRKSSRQRPNKYCFFARCNIFSFFAFETNRCVDRRHFWRFDLLNAYALVFVSLGDERALGPECYKN